MKLSYLLKLLYRYNIHEPNRVFIVFGLILGFLMFGPRRLLTDQVDSDQTITDWYGPRNHGYRQYKANIDHKFENDLCSPCSFWVLDFSFFLILKFLIFFSNFHEFWIFCEIIFRHPFRHIVNDYSLYQYRQYQQLLDHMPHHQWRYRNDSLMAILSHLCNLYRLSNHYQIEVCQMDCYLD